MDIWSIKRYASIGVTFLCVLVFVQASSAGRAAAQSASADNGDGTFSNPVVPADYPDCDPIRVGDDYYLISSSFHSVPGDPILHSRDLVNWEIAGHAILGYDDDPRYNMQGGTRYGLGSWAPSLRYHDGVFYVLFNTNDHGAFVSRATNVAGPWSMNALNVRLYDPGLFFEDDGSVWVVSGQGTLSLTELTSDLRGVKTPPKVIFEGHHYDEGSHVYKRNGFYYILNATSRSDLPTRYALQIERSRSLSGPFVSRVIFQDDANWKGWGLHQGGFVSTPKGNWWAILFQDRGSFGREPMLQPVKWVDDWPELGVNGRAVVTYKKPDTGHSEGPYTMCRSDNFSQPQLGQRWEWNHNPDPKSYSLTERPGWLRLRTANVTQSWRDARNTLWQRLVEGGKVTVTAELDVSGMLRGDIAGLGMFQSGTSSIAIAEDETRTIALRNQDKIVASGPSLGTHAKVWLRLQTPALSAETQYFYSLNGHDFVALGTPQPMSFKMVDVWIGERIALFNFATASLGGRVDVKSFSYDVQSRSNLFRFSARIDARLYDEIEGGSVDWINDPSIMDEGKEQNGGNYDRSVGNFEHGGWLKFARVDLGKGPRVLQFSAAGGRSQMIVRLDSPTGQIIASCLVGLADYSRKFEVQDCPMNSPRGIRSVYLTFVRGGSAGTELAWLRLMPANNTSR
jgi:beta-xylosidase